MHYWIEQVARARAGFGAVRFNNQDYEKERIIYAPVHDWASDIWCAGYLARDYIVAEQQAEGLRRSLLDEEIPLEQELVGNNLVLRGGRVNSAILLGMIRYTPALPELREASLHDLHESMRHESIDALGNMQNATRKYAQDIMHIIEHDQSLLVRGTAAQALKKIGNKTFSYRLLEQSEEVASLTRRRFVEHFQDRIGHFHDFSQTALVYRFILECLVALNPKVGREALKKGLNDESPAVYHEAKTVCFSSGNIHFIKPHVYIAKDMNSVRKV